MNVAVLGGGQLARMMALAGTPLGMSFAFLDPAPDAPAGSLGRHVRAGFEDPEGLDALGAWADVATWDFENVPAASAQRLAQQVPVCPPPRSLEVSQDRVVEKEFLRSLGIPVPAFAAVDSDEALRAALAAIGTPSVLKTRRFGYDGKGQRLIRTAAEAEDAWRELEHRPSVLEAFVPFSRELSLVAARGQNGAVAAYPLVENEHGNGILRLTRAPAPRLSRALQRQAEDYVGRMLARLEYVGVLALELFQVGDGLLANEFAPRVHNSGHWTIEGARTSQFENHLRALAGFPLGPAEAVEYSAMVNLIGTVPDPAPLLALPDAHLHVYGKVPRPGRKLGHVTVLGSTEAERDARLEEILARI
ncbi:MAG TPA: 5-(carboxyamino)imidazole ribonucleotide synthase [Candidatus Polarisedimenticolaceae bacterium]|nr:5-(carboxyamino)imidazole ribonucleotide synthase [Candidatus Polarisedimenticolaceae bacterium]